MTNTAQTGKAARFWRATATLQALTGLLFLYLEIRFALTGEPLNLPIGIILALDLLLAAAMVLQPRAWLIWPALLVLVVGFIGDLPHQIAAINQPESAEQVIFAVVVTIVQVSAIVAAVGCVVTIVRHARTIATVF